jgi:hypothetical protein
MKESPMVTKMKQRLRDNLKVNYKDYNIPRTNGIDTPSIKNVLESSVDEKYYLSNEKTEKLLQLAKMDNATRKQTLKGRAVSPTDSNKVESGKLIATRNLSRNGGLLSEVSPTVQASETPHIIED